MWTTLLWESVQSRARAVVKVGPTPAVPPLTDARRARSGARGDDSGARGPPPVRRRDPQLSGCRSRPSARTGDRWMDGGMGESDSRADSDAGARTPVMERRGSSASSAASSRRMSESDAAALSADAGTPSGPQSAPTRSTSAATDYSTAAALAGAEVDGLGIKGHLSMRDEGVTYHRMKRFFCRCVGVNFYRFPSRDTASAVVNALRADEIAKVENWDGRGLLHTYRNSFKISFVSGAVFNADADSEDDKRLWIAYIEAALKGASAAADKWKAHEAVAPNIMDLTLGGLMLAQARAVAPDFKGLVSCVHPGCVARFDSTGKRQHHCRNCGGTVCSDHSSHYALLRHYHMKAPVRLCKSCFRVQEFILWLTMLVQRLSIAQVEPVEKPELSKMDEEELDALLQLVSEEGFGISDVIQVLHLHRHGCDEAYAVAVNKLLELAASNLQDFEFFLPQLFHMWLTVDWARNTIKSALLFRVISFAAQLHIRFATSVYWLTRAAIDDSCGWGFGQSELYVPDFLFRKLSKCKLLMINLEMQISRGDWAFKADQDLPASDLQATIIKCLFDRLLILVQSDVNVYNPLGSICDATSICAVPTEFLLPSDSLIEDADNGGREERRVFDTQIQFIQELCDVTERLRHSPPDLRKLELKLEMEKLALPEGSFCPLGSILDPLQKFITIARGEGTVFTTRARAPTLFFFEVEELTGSSAKSAWLHRGRSLTFGNRTDRDGDSSDDSSDPSCESSSRNAIELATQSDIAQALALEPLAADDDDGPNGEGSMGSPGSSAVKNSGFATASGDSGDESCDSEGESRDRVASNPLEFAAKGRPDSTKGKRFRSHSGSLINSTTKSLDSIIAAVRGGRSARRKRSMSEGGDFEEPTKDSSLPFNAVEKFTEDQMVSMAQNLELSLLAETPSSAGIFTGKEVVEWMTKNEIVSDKAHAIWLGGELVGCGALEPTSLSPDEEPRFVPVETASYRLQSESSALSKKRGGNKSGDHNGQNEAQDSASTPANPTPSSSNGGSVDGRGDGGFSNSGSDNRVLLSTGSDHLRSSGSFRNSGVLSSNGLAPSSKGLSSGDERQSVLSVVHPPSFFDKFQPEAALSAMGAVEQAMEQHVLSQDDLPDADQLRENLRFLKEQVEMVHDYVVEKRNQRHTAVESAFGESFEEKKKRLRMSSRHLDTFDSSKWDCVAFIVKSNDDLRQEVLCQQLIRQIQDIFQSAELPLRLLPYSIIATSASTGMIEYVKDAVSLDSLKKRKGYTTLADHFRKTYGGTDSLLYKTAMSNFVRSMAGYSLACYFLQIKDRHNGNIMIDSEGHVVHIDFGFILGIAPGGRFSLETAPFKLTAEMVEAMGGTQSEYFKAYVIFLIQGFLALQVSALGSSLRRWAQQLTCVCVVCDFGIPSNMPILC